jgi:hypothetical protein
VALRRLRQMRRLCRVRLARLRRLRRLRRLLLLDRTLPRLLRRQHVPTTSKDMNCYGRVLLDPAYFALFAAGILASLAAAAANNVDKDRHAG